MPRLWSLRANIAVARRIGNLTKNVKFVRPKATVSSAQIAAGDKRQLHDSVDLKQKNVKEPLFVFLPAEYFKLKKKLPKTISLEIDEFEPKEECGLHLPAILRRKAYRVSEQTPSTSSSHQEIDVSPEKSIQWKNLPQLYLSLSKARLSTLVVITALGGYALCPAPLNIGALAACGIGTCLMSYSANAFNQVLETPFDSQMKRTQNRVLVKGQLSPMHAVGFAVASGFVGFSTLWLGANETAAILGLSNILLYAGIYTPMKRFTIYNTWVGSVVGAIPPLMGWAACSGGSLDASALTLAGILFAWQFPHFNSLSWNLRGDYSKAGYKMMAVTRPDLLGRTTVTYSLMLLGLSSLAVPLCGITTWTFAVTSLPVNLYFLYYSYRFYRETDSRNSKKLFHCSLLYLPILMALMLLSKNNVVSTVP